MRTLDFRIAELPATEVGFGAALCGKAPRAVQPFAERGADLTRRRHRQLDRAQLAPIAGAGEHESVGPDEAAGRSGMGLASRAGWGSRCGTRDRAGQLVGNA